MKQIFSEKPGAHERHLKRKHGNPLFGSPVISPAEIAQAQRQDSEEVSAFLERFRELVEQTANLEPNAEADVILKLKEQLDKSYEQCAGLAGDQSEIKSMLKRLVQVIMQAMAQGVGQDVQGQSKLQMEAEAREAHFALLEHALIADLLRPDSPVKEDELVATLLSESAASLRLALQLFAPEQQAVLYQAADELVKDLQAPEDVIERARQRLADMKEVLQPLNQMPS